MGHYEDAEFILHDKWTSETMLLKANIAASLAVADEIRLLREALAAPVAVWPGFRWEVGALMVNRFGLVVKIHSRKYFQSNYASDSVLKDSKEERYRMEYGGWFDADELRPVVGDEGQDIDLCGTIDGSYKYSVGDTFGNVVVKSMWVTDLGDIVYMVDGENVGSSIYREGVLDIWDKTLSRVRTVREGE